MPNAWPTRPTLVIPVASSGRRARSGTAPRGSATRTESRRCRRRRSSPHQSGLFPAAPFAFDLARSASRRSSRWSKMKLRRVRVVVGEDDERLRGVGIAEAGDHVPGRLLLHHRVPVGAAAVEASSATSAVTAAATAAGIRRARVQRAGKRSRRRHRRRRARPAPPHSSGRPGFCSSTSTSQPSSSSRRAIHSAAWRSPGEQAPRSSDARCSTSSCSCSRSLTPGVLAEDRQVDEPGTEAEHGAVQVAAATRPP